MGWPVVGRTLASKPRLLNSRASQSAAARHCDLKARSVETLGMRRSANSRSRLFLRSRSMWARVAASDAVICSEASNPTRRRKRPEGLSPLARVPRRAPRLLEDRPDAQVEQARHHGKPD